jgi:hypothetical protein
MKLNFVVYSMLQKQVGRCVLFGFGLLIMSPYYPTTPLITAFSHI